MRILILERTINILKEKTSDGEEILKKFEEKNGKILNQAKRELEQLATRKQEIDESKALILEEYSKSIKKGYEQTNPNHEKKKRDPQSATPDPRESHEAAKKERDETEKIFGECQDKYH